MKIKMLILAVCFALITAFSPVSSFAMSEETKPSYHYLQIDGKSVTSSMNASNIASKVKVTVVFPQKDEEGRWMSYGFTSRDKYLAFVSKQVKKEREKLGTLGTGGSGSCRTDFYQHINKGGSWISVNRGSSPNLGGTNWNDVISSLSTAQYRYTDIWEHIPAQGYGDGLAFPNNSWYGYTANLTDFPINSSTNTKTNLGMIK